MTATALLIGLILSIMSPAIPLDDLQAQENTEVKDDYIIADDFWP